MKKTLILVLTCLTLLVSFTACNTTQVTVKQKNHDAILEFIEKRGDVNGDRHNEIHFKKSLVEFKKFREETKDLPVPKDIQPKNL